jgi:phenylacetate-CoA ligase
LRFGGNYKTIEASYHNRSTFNKKQWNEYQTKMLAELLAICEAKVPYYAREWTSEQKSAAFRGDLHMLPLLEKAAVRANPMDFVRTDFTPLHRITNYTSGSTGTPIATLWTPSEIRDSLAVREVRSANWAGVSFKFPRATFSGRMVEPDPNSKGPYYRYNAVEKQVYFSPFHLRPDNCHFYVDALWKHEIQWMTGYAVSYYLLAKFILDAGLSTPKLKAVITTSEKLTPKMRSTMEEAYHCRIYEEYSTVENALFASECEQGRLHVSPDVGIVEILRSDSSPCNFGEIGEVVTTSFRSYQPLVRYRLGDLAAWDSEPCTCGRSMPVIKEVVGRIEDTVVGPDGRQMVRFHGIFINQPHIIEGQIIQESLNQIRVKIVPTAGFEQSDEDDIIHRVQQRLGNGITVTVERVESIPRTKSGKFKSVISKVLR